VYRAGLVCRQCGDLEPHELQYAGRLLASTKCLTCGAVVKHDESHLRRAYLSDLESRVRTKPGRMVKRAVQHPAKYMAHLPFAILTKPAKLLEEAKPLLGGLRGARTR
jgi:hypothetical protein